MLDFEDVIRLHGGDLKKALESVVSERNKLVRQFFRNKNQSLTIL